MNIPDKNQSFPLAHYDRLCFLKNKITNPNIIVGDYTYYDDFETVDNFEKNVKYHFDFVGDKLIIGKFCMIASDVQFIMNGANHLSQSISAYPFAIFGGDWANAMEGKSYPKKADTEIGNDIWIGYGATIMPGVKIGDGAIIATQSVVTKDIPPYAIVGGNPATVIRYRFMPQQIEQLLDIAWWDWDIQTITANVQLLTDNNFEALKQVKEQLMNNIQLAERFAFALDEDQFEIAKSTLHPDCTYAIGDQVLDGPDTIIHLYESNMKEGRKKFDELEWGKAIVEATSPKECLIHFSDFLKHKGISHQYRCQQKLTIENGAITKIEHIEDETERKNLNAFYKKVGLL